MLGMTVEAAKEGFFDRELVLGKVGVAKAKVFNQSGRLVRAAAQKSLKYGDRASAPGSPPTAHKSRLRKRTSKRTGKSRVRSVSFLREFLFYAFDKQAEDVVIGPAQLNQVLAPGIPGALEHGGPSTVLDHGELVKVQIAPRPFMVPALASKRAEVMNLWSNSVK